MKKSIYIIILALFFSMNITGCSLFSSSEDEQETATVAEDGSSSGEVVEKDGDDFESDGFEGGDDSDANFDAEAMAKDDGGEEMGDLAGQDVEVEDNFDDEYSDDDYDNGKSTTATVAGAEKAGGDDDGFSDDFIDDNSFADEGSSQKDTTDELFADEGGGLPAETMSSNEEQDLFGQETMEPVVDTPTFADSSFDGDAVYDVPAEPSFVPVKKMKPAAYTRAGGNVNRLYVVRSGDNMDSIAEKLYGNSSKSKDLYAYNSHFTGKTLRVGDKIYYQSPNNPNDQTMLTYYEDNNISPSYYTSREGDNIRKISKKLLGHERSWMEVYATNANVESKGRLPAGLQLRYWSEGTSTPTMMAMNDSEPEQAPAMEKDPAVPPPAAAAESMDESAEVAMDEPQDIPDFEESPDSNMEEPTEVADAKDPTMDGPGDDMSGMGAAAGQANNNIPPPPKPVAPPPPPPVPKPALRKPKAPQVKINTDSEDPLAAIGNDSVIMGGLGMLFILAAIITLIFIRRNRAKRVNFSQTQV